MDANLSLKTHLFIEAGFKNKVYFQPYNTNTFVIGKINRNIGENHAISKIHNRECRILSSEPHSLSPSAIARGKNPQFLKKLEIIFSFGE